MSKVAITGNASGTGVFTVASPNSNVDRVLTLPDESGTVITTQRSGNVIQVVSTTKTDSFSMSGATFTDVTGLSVSITPTDVANKIYVIYSITLAGQSGAAATVFQLVRDSTDIVKGDVNGSRPRYTGSTPYIPDPNAQASVGGNFLDSPATTSAVIYKIQIASSGAVSSYVNRSQNYANSTNNYDGTSTSTITVMEISG